MKLKELLLLTSKQKENGFFIRGNNQCGEFKYYKENRQLWSQGSYLNGKKHGEFTYYWKSGQLIEYQLYKNGILIKDYLK